MSEVVLHIFPFWTLHFLTWTPHIGWTPRLNYILHCAKVLSRSQ